MDQTLLVDFKQRLEKELERITQEIDALGGLDVTYPESGSSSDDDNAAEISEYADEISLADRLAAELKDAKKALQAIENGTYGTCKYCGKDIDIKRLEARPTSSSCIECKKSLTQEM